MAFFGGSTNAAAQPNYTQMQLQTSAYGVVIPVIYGTTRVGWNLGDYLDFKSFKTPSSSGGKGGVIGGGGKGSSSTSYSATLLGILSEGPITGVFSSWLSQTQSAGTPNFDLFDGAIAQSPWSYLSTNFPSHALTYSGFAYVTAENYDLGTSANLPNINWEVQGFLQGTAPGIYGGNGCAAGGDADPSQVVPDMLTNQQYGIGFPGARVGQVSNNAETHTIPGSPFQITVSLAAQFSYNVNVLDETTGQLMTCVANGPGAGDYAFANGVYTFAASDSGHTVSIRYASVGPMTNYQNFVLASGLWISPAYTDQAQASQLLDDIATATYSDFIWSSGVLQLIPRGTVVVSGNGYTYTPDNNPLFSLGPDDFMPNSNGTGNSSSDDPIQITRTRTSDQLNDIKLEVLDRANQYAPAIVEAMDQALIDRYGRRPSASKSMHLFADLNAGNVSVKLQLQDEYIRNNYSFQMDERYIILDPMDLVEVTDPDYPGLTDIGVRLLDIQENDDGTLSFQGEEYPGTIGTVPEFTLNFGSGLIQDFNVDPGDAAEPAVFDVPVQLAQVIGLETWLGTFSLTGNPNWGGCDVYLSTDNATFAKQGTLIGPSRMGVLSANLAAASTNPDVANTLSVNLTESVGVLESGTTADAQNGVTLCFVDGEYIAYANATLTSTYNYNLTYLERNMWGSANTSHLSGSLFVRLDDSVFKMPYNASDVGTTIYIKLVSFNIYGGGYQSLADVTSYSHVIGGPPTLYAPENLTVTASLKSNLLNWLNAPNVGQAAVEIWRSSFVSFSGAVAYDDVANYGTSYTDINVVSGTQYWYWIRARDIAGNYSLQFDPPTSGPGATNTTLRAITNDIGTEQVVTNNVATNAITSPNGTLAGTFTASANNVWYTLASFTGTFDGGQTLTSFTDYITWNTNGPRGKYQIIDDASNVLMTVGFGGGSCPDFICTAGGGVGAAGLSGVHTFYLQFLWEAGNAPTSNLPNLVVTELKDAR